MSLVAVTDLFSNISNMWRRWDIKIAPQLPPGKKSSKNQLRRTASKMQGRKEEPEKVASSYNPLQPCGTAATL